MIINTIGCSFTYAQQKGWPKILADKLNAELVNNGHPGAGNTYIGNKIVLDRYQHRYQKPDLVVIMWSGLTRKEVAVDHTDIVTMGVLDSYKDYVRWSGFDTSYILSGGIKGSWEWNPATKAIFDPLYKYSNERTMAQDTLLQILHTQNYLKQNNIKYLMSSYVNYWGNEDQVAQLDYGIGKFSDLKYLVDQIDFDRWVFANSNRDCIYELAKANNDLQEDGFHPDFKTHADWAELILQKLKTDN